MSGCPGAGSTCPLLLLGAVDCRPFTVLATLRSVYLQVTNSHSQAHLSILREGVMAELRRSTNYSFHRLIMSPIEVSSYLHPHCKHFGEALLLSSKVPELL
ncbi:hypothetical protein ATANTOWER_011927 [Ataeniobius toweri]|uniref:Uncharacterized protein n=1 Tax=Ataeniobius toweri TaxID=208326 RepID=A0ABU7B8R7_9TELE|nr:hypothetical protein [Ataeniobius toweri]